MPHSYRVINGRGVEVSTSTPGVLAGWRRGKIYGRLDCTSGMRMKQKNRVFSLLERQHSTPAIEPAKNANREECLENRSRFSSF